jgi:hypothetical protein
MEICINQNRLLDNKYLIMMLKHQRNQLSVKGSWFFFALNTDKPKIYNI